MLGFDSEKLKRRLDADGAEKRIAFGASRCERLLPNYYAFSAIEKWRFRSPHGGRRRDLEFFKGRIAQYGTNSTTDQAVLRCNSRHRRLYFHVYICGARRWRFCGRNLVVLS